MTVSAVAAASSSLRVMISSFFMAAPFDVSFISSAQDECTRPPQCGQSPPATTFAESIDIFSTLIEDNRTQWVRYQFSVRNYLLSSLCKWLFSQKSVRNILQKTKLFHHFAHERWKVAWLSGGDQISVNNHILI